MERTFIDLINISITAGYLVLAVLLLRPLLRKAPKFIRCVLWGFVGLRLAFPFSVESIFSLIPSAETVPQEILYSSQPSIHSGIPLMNSLVNPILSDSMAPAVGNSVNPMQVAMTVGVWIWIIGMVFMALYAGISYSRLRFKLREAVYEGEKAWVCDHIDSAFLLGIFKPRIYLPSALNDEDKRYVIAHEKAHLQRKDHWWKPLGFLLLTVYWFNPLMWVAYILLCRDIELACDEKVIRELGTDCKKSYSEALINCSVSKKLISACPVAFGEDGIKGRIRSILNYKKPAFWIILIAIILCIAVAVCFLTVPQSDVQLFGARYETGQCLYSAVVSADKETDSNNLIFDIHDNTFFSEVYKEYESGEREYLGYMLPWTYTEDKLNNTLSEQGISPVSLDQIQDNYALLSSAGALDYVFFSHTNGKVTMVSFFRDGSVMNIFELIKIAPCAQVNSTHITTLEAYVTRLDSENGYLIATVTAQDSELFQKSVHISSCPYDIAMGEKILILYDGTISATDQHPLSIQNPYSVRSELIYDYRFAGIVLETQNDAVLVEPAEGTDARQYADRFVVRSPNPDAFQIGDQVCVYYDLTEELNPPIIPYPCTIIKTDNSNELFNPSTVPQSGQIIYDIDSDGIAELCYVTEHYTRVHMLAVYVYENGILDYYDYFYSGGASGFSFLKNDDGTPLVLSADPQHIFTLSMQDSRLNLTDENGEQLIRLSERTADVATLQNVISKYPHFLNLSTAKGLEVYVWKNGDWRCGVRSGSNSNATLKELWAFEDGASLEEMAVILSTYDVSKEDIVIGYNYHPAFSGPYGVMPSAGEQAYIKATLLQYLVYKNFQPTIQYPLVIYAYQLAPSAWCFQFMEDTTIMHTSIELMNYPHCNLEAALEKLKDYDIPPGQIPVVVYQNPISSYYGGGITENTTRSVRAMLGLG